MCFARLSKKWGELRCRSCFCWTCRVTDEMRCEGSDERNGQMDWVVHFEQRKARPSRTAKVWVNGVAHPGMFKEEHWISKRELSSRAPEKAGLVVGVPDIGLEGMTFSVDYGLVQRTAGKAGVSGCRMPSIPIGTLTHVKASWLTGWNYSPTLHS